MPENIDDFNRGAALILAQLYIGFLADEGYLRFKNTTSVGDVYLHVVLTSKGLAALQRTPEVLDVRPKTAGDRLLEGIGMGTTEVAKGIIREAMRVIFGT